MSLKDLEGRGGGHYHNPVITFSQILFNYEMLM